MKKILSDETQVQTDGNMVQQSEEVSGETTQESSGFPMGMLAAVSGGAFILVGAITVMGNRSKAG